MTPAQAAEAAARRSYGRLLAWLAWQWRDIAAAEDALAEAFAAALVRWPAEGVPASPEGWLMTAAKRQLLMAARRRRLEEDPTLTVLWPNESTPLPPAPDLPDSQLRLLFVCTHPAIAPEVRSALMLQTVLGVETVHIASAFLVKPETMSKRLVRAKAKLKATGVRYEEPGPAERPARLASVLEAIYAAYTLHWGQADDASACQLAAEARYLAELVAALLPTEPEALGLAAMIWLCEARRPARIDAAGRFVPLRQQDTTLWDAQLMARADRYLVQAAALRSPGAFQLEAAIQSAHVHGGLAGAVPWAEIAVLYQHILRVAPTVGAAIGSAVATAQASDDARIGLRLLDTMDADRVSGHQPWWAARAHLLAMAGDHDESACAWGRALGLTAEPALRDWLSRQRDEQLSAAPSQALIDG